LLIDVQDNHKTYFAFLVLAAFFAEADRLSADLFLAADFAWRERADFDTVDVGSLFRAFTRALDLVREIGSCLRAFSDSRIAFVRVFSGTDPFFGGSSFTPALRASESPIAMACFVDLAPCSPFRIFSISSCTNSPAWVLADFPSLLSSFAFSIVDLSGILQILNVNNL
jgi:hypothetical protein